MTTLADIQRHVGVAPDGKWGPNTAAAIGKALGLTASAGHTISAKGIALIKEYEGLRLKAYPDPATGGEPWTIGVGHTDRGVVKPGMVITEAQADAYLRSDVARFEAAVNLATPTTTQDQFDAMVSLAFNVGECNFTGSTLVRKHIAGDYDGAAAEFARWNKANGSVMAGLTRRRAAEASLYRGAA